MPWRRPPSLPFARTSLNRHPPPAACRCGPCVLLAKELETVAEKLGEGVRILKIDTDANPDISTQLQVGGGRGCVSAGGGCCWRCDGRWVSQVVRGGVGQ
jgi:hypothetical protein